jgi:hypothetical protein
MPTVVMEGGYRIVVYTRDHMPPHIHVFKAGHEAKFILWNSEVKLYDGTNMTNRELDRAAELCAKHYNHLVVILREMPWVKK